MKNNPELYSSPTISILVRHPIDHIDLIQAIEILEDRLHQND